MLKNNIKTVKISAIIIGTLLLLISSQLEFVSLAYEAPPSSAMSFHKSYKGFVVPIWQASAIGAALLFLLSFFRNTLVYKINYYIILTITLFLTTVFALTFSTDTAYYTNDLEYGFYVEQLGFVLILFGTLIYLHRPYVKKKEEDPEILDSGI